MMERRWASAGREEGSAVSFHASVRSFPARAGAPAPGGRGGICHVGEDPNLPLLSPQSKRFLFFSSNVISDCTEIIIIFNQEILHFKIINEQCFQTSF